jgi:hypothetical protein
MDVVGVDLQEDGFSLSSRSDCRLMTDVSSLSPTDESYRDELVRSWSEHVSPLACVCVVCAVR